MIFSVVLSIALYGLLCECAWDSYQGRMSTCAVRGSSAWKECLGLLCLACALLVSAPGHPRDPEHLTLTRMHGQEVHANVLVAGTTAAGCIRD